MPEWLLGGLVTLGVNIAFFIYGYGKFRGAMDRRNKEEDARWVSFEQKIDQIPVLVERMGRQERDHFMIHEWKRVILPQELKQRDANIKDHIDRLEKRVERIEGHR